MRHVRFERVALSTLVLGSLFSFSSVAFAAPPSTPYAPTETLTPSCNPGSTNCTVRPSAVSGANPDITSLSGLTTALSVLQGGTGTTTFSINGILFGNNASSIQSTSAGSASQILRIPSGGGAPSFGAIDMSQSAAITGILPILQGGTGASTASGARTLLGAASSGVNADVTSLTGLSTPLSATQGGSGLSSITNNQLLIGGPGNTWTQISTSSLGIAGISYTAGNGITLASNQFSVNQSQLNLNSLGGPLLVVNGGTGAVSTSSARTNLLAAASGANADITSLSALTTGLSLAQGGTGTTTAFNAGSIIFAGASGNYNQNNSNFFWDNTTNRLGIGTNTPASALEVNGVIAGIHLKGLGAAPSISAGAGAGSGPTISIRGTDTAGEITLTTGTLPTLSATVLTLTFATSYGTAPFISIVPANALTAILSGATMVFPTISTSALSLTSGLTALTAATTYKWDYVVIQ